MLNFVICDDNDIIRENICKVITKLMLPIDVEYKTIFFSSFNKDFNQMIYRSTGRKIYILDIEVGNYSGLDIARKIREKDWESIIIILTAHYELAYDAFKNRLMLLDFISKFDDYQKNLYDSLQLAIKILNNKEQLVFKIRQTIHKLDYNDILYIMKADGKRNVLITTFYQEYSTSLTLTEVEGKLSNDFIKTHRACIVNKNNIKFINFKDKEIVFKNDKKIGLLSKKYKKEVKQHVSS